MDFAADAAAADVTTPFRKALNPAHSDQAGWLYRVASAYLHYRDARGVKPAGDLPETQRAQQIIRRACIKSSITGAAAGTFTTGTTILAAESGPAGLLFAVPSAALGIGGEMIYRLLVHLDMTCALAETFGVRFDPHNASDFWQLMGLAFGTHKHESEDPGAELVSRIAEVEAHEVSESIGAHLLGESLIRNAIPVVGIVTSSYSSWKLTRRLGDTVRRYVRYRRAIHDAIGEAEGLCQGHLDLLVEGMWFLFVADGQLSHEEAGLIARHLGKLEPALRARVEGRFVTDESDWVTRLAEIPEGARDAFLHALEVAAAVDKKLSLPEQKILIHAARALGRTFDELRVERMIRQFEEVGVISPSNVRELRRT